MAYELNSDTTTEKRSCGNGPLSWQGCLLVSACRDSLSGCGRCLSYFLQAATFGSRPHLLVAVTTPHGTNVLARASNWRVLLEGFDASTSVTRRTLADPLCSRSRASQGCGTFSG